MVNISINPGSGPVDNATEKNAIENIKHFITDCTAKNLAFLRIPERDIDGRFCFLLYKNDFYAGVHNFVDMPGLPLDKVRYMKYMKENGQSAWDYPRLYVNGSSWLWEFALLDEAYFKYDPSECEE